ncbi:hypothetical protein WJX81_000684 [Elliptochloris bilobata]|uniref:Uncharacterized protein n=1 Tax=Elliptochloris bilobata TaxID=381761 RepID=A0AAW1RNI7_9CHLO
MPARYPRSAWRCRASREQDKVDQAVGTKQDEERQAPPPEAPATPQAEPQSGLAKGQTTAIVTGVVSILFGVRRILVCPSPCSIELST